LSLEWKREGVMDGDSSDEGNDELTCVSSDDDDDDNDDGFALYFVFCTT